MRKMTGVPIVATAVLCCLCAPARATTYVVDQSGGGDFTNVQEGVDYAASGDTLLIMAGLYTENVVCPGKCLAYVGEGAGLSLVTAAEAAPTFDIQGPPGESAFAYMSVIPHDAPGRSVVWDMNRVALEHCEIPGRLGGGSSSSSFASVTITDCVVQRVDVWGGWLTSTITNSTVGPAAFHGRYIWEWGADWCQAHLVETSYSMLGDVSLSCDSNIDSHSDIMGVLSGGDGSSCSAVGTSFEGIDLGLGDLELVDCAVRGPVEVHGYAGVSDNTTWDVGIAGTLVEGDLVLHYVAFSDQVVFTIELVHNTVAGDLTTLFDFSGSPTYVDQYHVLSNIV